MRCPTLLNRAAASAALALGLAGCTAGSPSGIDSGDSTVPAVDPAWYTVHNDPAYLDTRLRVLDRPLGLRQDDGSGNARTPQSDNELLMTQLVLVGEVLSPVVDGHVTQASDIDLDPSFRIAAVAYGTAGPERGGAVQIIDFADATQPRLVSEILFHGADVHAIVRMGSFYYAGVARDGSDTPAAVEELRTFSGGVFPTGMRRTVPSHVVTDLAYTSSTDIVATCGDQGGGVVHLARAGLQILAFTPLHDARGVAFGPAGEVRCVSGGATPFLSRFGFPGIGLLDQSPVDGFHYAETKGTIEVAGSYSFIGAGDGGFLVCDADGTLLDRVDNAAAEVMPELAVTNAVSVRTDLAFMACGARGVQVVDLGRWNPAAPAGTTNGLTVLGTLDFPDGMSSNMVKARSNVLVVAAGAGGVKLVRMADAPSS